MECEMKENMCNYVGVVELNIEGEHRMTIEMGVEIEMSSRMG